jgi:catechol 2,3-dioxygenase-like lactoylglutathione lyase family enzyme
VELAEIVLYVSDMERAIRFYRDTIRLEVDVESEDWTTFRTGACTLALHLVEQRKPGIGEPDPTFTVADATAERERLAAGRGRRDGSPRACRRRPRFRRSRPGREPHFDRVAAPTRPLGHLGFLRDLRADLLERSPDQPGDVHLGDADLVGDLRLRQPAEEP